MLSLIDETDFF